VLNQGEKARNVVAAFSGPKDVSSKLEAAAAPQPRRPMLPLAVAGVGGAAAVTGAVLVAVGLHQVPSNCSLSSRQCTATPGDPSFGAARQGVSLANVGIGVGLGGATMLVGGLVWYFLQPPRLPTEGAHLEAVQPWIGYGSGGVAMSARF
jgi:hypothetical protein